jgi:hypothetical protein
MRLYILKAFLLFFSCCNGSIMLLLLMLLVIVFSVFCGVFFYCQAVVTGFGRKRWTMAGIVFGPLIWPMFAMKKRMQQNRILGFEVLIFRA